MASSSADAGRRPEVRSKAGRNLHALRAEWPRIGAATGSHGLGEQVVHREVRDRSWVVRHPASLTAVRVLIVTGYRSIPLADTLRGSVCVSNRTYEVFRATGTIADDE
jgi:hypothetical protein